MTCMVGGDYVIVGVVRLMLGGFGGVKFFYYA
jgi:hypothetical protein